MKIPLSYVKLRDVLDSVEPINTTGLSTGRGWKLTLDTDTDYIQGILTRGDGPGASVRRVEFHCLAAAHWVRENWDEPVDFAGMGRGQAAGAVFDYITRPRAEIVFGEGPTETPKPKPTGGKRGRKGPRAGSSEAHRVQPEGAGGDDPQP